MDKEILKDFVVESKQIVKDCLNLLESIEEHYEKASLLESYGNNMDRIMGGATTIALDVSDDHVLNMISDYAAVCKNVGYKASQIKVNQAFFDVCVALLIDATEMLSLILEKTDLPPAQIQKVIPEEFISRLKWVLNQFNKQVRSTVGQAASFRKEDKDLDKVLKRISKK